MNQIIQEEKTKEVEAKVIESKEQVSTQNVINNNESNENKDEKKTKKVKKTNKKLNLDDLIFLHTKKTGALIAASMQMGAVIAGCGEESCDQIYFTGIDLGLAFQIHDDILDATSTSEDVGKPVQNDAFKNSFTNLLGVEEAIKFRDNLEDKIISSLENTALKNLISNLINQYLRG